jgi:hypothetical protein
MTSNKNFNHVVLKQTISEKDGLLNQRRTQLTADYNLLSNN